MKTRSLAWETKVVMLIEEEGRLKQSQSPPNSSSPVDFPRDLMRGCGILLNRILV